MLYNHVFFTRDEIADYCYWQPCNNPECLYLHDEGTREDSFTKEEMLANYGRYTCLVNTLVFFPGVYPL